MRTDVHRVAATVLGRFDGIEQLPATENLVYRVRRSGGDAVLRLTPIRRRTEADLRAELAWLNHLAERLVDTVRPWDLEPSGPYLVAGVPHFCVRFGYLGAARVDPATVDAAFLHRCGRLLGAIHAASRDLTPVGGPQRRHWRDTDNYDLGSLALSRAGRAAADEVLSRANAGDQLALVHGDLGLANLLHVNGRLVAIDFDDACWAPPAYDLAATLYDVLVDWGAAVRVEPAAAVAALVAGYHEAAAVADAPELVPRLWAALVIERAITPRRLGTRDDPADRRLGSLLETGRLPAPLDGLLPTST